MTRIISALLILLSSAAFTARAADAPLELAADAPARHTVVRGDTLWDLSKHYLKDPFRWPELWGFNKDQIKNPHWIYPGQVLVLYYDENGQPRLRIEGQGSPGAVPTVKVAPEVHMTDMASVIPAIPRQVIEPFLSQPLIVEESTLATAPRIVATQNNRTLSGDNDVAYVTGMKSEGAMWQIFRPGRELKDPVTNELLGHEAVFLGTARLVAKGDPATVRILNARQETGKDDLLVKAPPPEIVNYPMHRPEGNITSRVVSNYGEHNASGKYAIIAISGGKKSGIGVGQVFAISRTGMTVTDRYQGETRDVVLPDERLGLAYVFRTFDKVSYAVVMEANQPVEVGDKLSSP